MSLCYFNLSYCLSKWSLSWSADLSLLKWMVCWSRNEWYFWAKHNNCSAFNCHWSNYSKIYRLNSSLTPKHISGYFYFNTYLNPSTSVPHLYNSDCNTESYAWFWGSVPTELDVLLTTSTSLYCKHLSYNWCFSLVCDSNNSNSDYCDWMWITFYPSESSSSTISKHFFYSWNSNY